MNSWILAGIVFFALNKIWDYLGDRMDRLDFPQEDLGQADGGR